MKIEIFEHFDEVKLIENREYVIFITEEFIEDIEKLKKKEFKVYVIVVPYIIYNKKCLDKGVMIWEIEDGRVKIFDMQKDFEYNFKNNSIIVFCDGISAYFENFIDRLNNKINANEKVLGAGIGYKDFSHKPTIFDGKSFLKDQALIIGLDLDFDIDFSYGWKPLYGPLVATKTKDNILYELNSEPAFDVYKKILKEIEDVEIDKDNFFDIAKSYPFAIMSYSMDNLIIRDPIGVNEDGSIQIVSSIDEMESLYIMKGNKKELIDSSCRFADRLFKNSSKRKAFIFDSISRVIFLGNDFNKEIESIFTCSHKNNLEIVGIASIGEITNIHFDKIKILNKTNLIGAYNEK